jgi:hypothetical protein
LRAGLELDDHDLPRPLAPVVRAERQRRLETMLDS